MLTENSIGQKAPLSFSSRWRWSDVTSSYSLRNPGLSTVRFQALQTARHLNKQWRGNNDSTLSRSSSDKSSQPVDTELEPRLSSCVRSNPLSSHRSCKEAVSTKLSASERDIFTMMHPAVRQETWSYNISIDEKSATTNATNEFRFRCKRDLRKSSTKCSQIISIAGIGKTLKTTALKKLCFGIEPCSQSAAETKPCPLRLQSARLCSTSFLLTRLLLLYLQAINALRSF